MKVSELNQIIENALNGEIKKTILNEMEESKKEVYHIKCEGIPLATFSTEEEANKELPKYEAKHKGELIIEKGVYESHDDMMEKLDELNDQLEEIDNMENTQMDEKLFGNQSKLDKNKNGKIDSQDFKLMKGEKSKKEGDVDENAFVLAADAAKDAGKKEFEFPKGSGKMHKVTIKKDIPEEKQMCSECGGAMNEEGMCNECGMGGLKESKKKTVRLTETELIDVIKKIVKESVPGLNAYKKAHEASGNDSKRNIGDVTKKMKDYLSIEGNDNPEFPKQIGKGEKVARHNSKEEDEIVADNRGGGLEDLYYEIKPSEKFNERMKEALEGSSKMGNSQDAANVVKSDLGKKIQDKVERKKKKEKAEDTVSWGHAWKEPESVNVVKKESKIEMFPLLNEEIQKMKRISNYNKKTQ